MDGPDARRLLYLDLETTGTDPESDRIVELAAARHGEDREPVVRRYHPGRPIPPGATAVHGISDRDVAEAPAFAEEAARIQALVEGRVLCGYNIRSFDTVMLDRELRRAGQQGIDLDEVREVDLMRVWEEMEGGRRRGDGGEAGSAGERSRSGPAPDGEEKGPGWTLSDAVRRFLDRDLEQAHSAAADTSVLPDLLAAFREVHGLSLEEMMVLSRRPDEVDRAGKLRRRRGEIVYAFGKHRGEPVREHPDYAEWMLGADFPSDTKRFLRRLLADG